MRDQAVLEEGLIAVADVVDDDLRSRVVQGLDVLHEAEVAGAGRRELEIRPRRDVVDALQHGTALVVPLPGPSGITVTGLLGFRSPELYDSCKPPST